MLFLTSDLFTVAILYVCVKRTSILVAKSSEKNHPVVVEQYDIV